MITLAALTLHNFLLTEPNSEYNTTSNMERQGKEVSEGSWFDFSPRGSNNYSNEAKVIRDEFKQYFNNEGAVPWQWVQCGLDRMSKILPPFQCVMYEQTRLWN